MTPLSDISPKIVRMLNRVEFFVEADSYAELNLWSEHHKKTEWCQIKTGYSVLVGTLRKGTETYPVYVNFSFALVNNKMIAFYTSESQLVDWVAIEEFICHNFPVKYDNGTRRAMTNAMNFHNCLIHCLEKDVYTPS